jgi:beta-lactamase regulating signal transducer with metallopeptidase domain
MNGWQYLLLVNIYLVLFYGFYTLLLRRETFFHLNRIYLVASALLSFFIPVIHSDWVRNLFITQEVQHTLSVYSNPIIIYHFKPIEDHHITMGQIIVVIYAIGAGILIAKFIWQLISLKRIIDRPEAIGAFSFFKSIRLGANLDKQGVIAAHEQVHARQWHSADVLLIEAIAIINWFNPVVYFYRFGIKHIHEFIADRQALKNGMDKAEYALLLLSQTFRTPAHQLVNPFFNHSLLKQRIIMLQKSHSQRVALLKYGLSAPLFILMLILSAATISKSTTVKLLNKKAEEVFLIPAIRDSASVQQVQTEEVKANKTEVKINRDAFVSVNKAEDDSIFVTVEKEPEFKGGISEFYRFLGKNIKYPDAMLKKNVQGKVFISLTVEKDGSLSDIKPVRDIGFGAAEEAIRVLKL